MKIKGNRFVTSILAASMLSGTFFVPASAGELEGESAIAGMAVTLNNYYAGEETPDESTTGNSISTSSISMISW